MEIEFEHLGSNGPEAPEPESPESTGARAVLLLAAVGVVLIGLFLVARPESGETAAGTPRTSSTTTAAAPVTTALVEEDPETSVPSTTPRGPTLATPAITIGDVYPGDDGHDRIRILAFPEEAVAIEGGWLATPGGLQPGLFFSDDGLHWSTVEVRPNEASPIQLHTDGENVFATGVDRNMTRSWLRNDDGTFELLDTIPLLGQPRSHEILDVSLTSLVTGNNVELHQPVTDDQLAERLSEAIGEPVDPSVCAIELTDGINYLDCTGEVVETHRFDEFTDEQINCIFTMGFQARSRARIILDYNGREGALELTPGLFLAGLRLVNGGAVALVANLDGFCTDDASEVLQLLLLDVNGGQTVLAQIETDLVSGPVPHLATRNGSIHLLTGDSAFVVSNSVGELLPDLVEIPRPEGVENGRFVVGGGPLLGFVETTEGRVTGNVWLSLDGLTWTAVQVSSELNDINLLASSEQMAILTLLGPLATELVRVTIG